MWTYGTRFEFRIPIEHPRSSAQRTSEYPPGTRPRPRRAVWRSGAQPISPRPLNGSELGTPEIPYPVQAPFAIEGNWLARPFRCHGGLFRK